jgi:FG-GAP-like repeat
LDIIVSNDAPDRKLVYLNDGKGHFTEAGTFGSPNWTTRYVTLADLNGDGYPDIVVANRGDHPDLVGGKPGEGPKFPTPSFVCLNEGKGHFPACETLPTESATSIVAADLDGDGALDLFVPHRRWRPEHHFVERWEGTFPDIYESWAGACLDPHGRRRRLRWGRAARSGVHR